MNFRKTKSGSYVNLDHVQEIGVVPFYDEGKQIFIITYWTKNESGEDLPGWYKTEKEAQKALDEFMKRAE